jgi:hypothetical protein
MIYDICIFLEMNVHRKLEKQIKSRLLFEIKRRLRLNESAEQLLGCTVPEFKIYIEKQFLPGMTWDNLGRWHCDHIRPLSTFDLCDPLARQTAFHFTNIRALWAESNLSRPKKGENLVNASPEFMSLADVPADVLEGASCLVAFMKVQHQAKRKLEYEEEALPKTLARQEAEAAPHLSDFIEKMCMRDEKEATSLSTMFDAYIRWVNEAFGTAAQSVSWHAFLKNMKKQFRLPLSRQNNKLFYNGIGLRPPTPTSSSSSSSSSETRVSECASLAQLNDA